MKHRASTTQETTNTVVVATTTGLSDEGAAALPSSSSLRRSSRRPGMSRETCQCCLKIWPGSIPYHFRNLSTGEAFLLEDTGPRKQQGDRFLHCSKSRSLVLRTSNKQKSRRFNWSSRTKIRRGAFTTYLSVCGVECKA